MCRRRKGGRCTKGTAGKDISKIIHYSFFSNLVKIVEVVWHILTNSSFKNSFFLGNFQHLQLRAQIKRVKQKIC